MNVKKELVLRQLMGENMLVPCGKTVLENNGLFMLTDVGAFIWKILPQCQTGDEITALVEKEYDVEHERAKADVDEFLQMLRGYGIID